MAQHVPSKQTVEVAQSRHLWSFPSWGCAQSRAIHQQLLLAHDGAKAHSDTQRIWNVEQQNWQQQTCCPQMSKKAHPRACQRIAACDADQSNARIQPELPQTQNCKLLPPLDSDPIGRSLAQHLSCTRGRFPHNGIMHEVGANKRTGTNQLSFWSQRSRVGLLRWATTHRFPNCALQSRMPA